MKEVTGVRFSISNPNLVYNSCRDGSVRVWDLRNIRHPVSKFVANTEGKVKPLSCFDFNCNEQFLCAGTDLYDDNSYLLFWDFRSNKILGGYWDSHSDDITQVSKQQLIFPVGARSSSTRRSRTAWPQPAWIPW
ncbi:hypothetical protein V5799_015366 [Amblyomma americanum]|uniref:WD repeat-containing protein 89 n=1 Tax=Amblyomma americanum TaxID=6943 RepID=A0AAQ4E0C9_AMBAM